MNSYAFSFLFLVKTSVWMISASSSSFDRLFKVYRYHIALDVVDRLQRGLKYSLDIYKGAVVFFKQHW